MSVTNREVAFTLDDADFPFTGIQELGFTERGAFVVSAWTTGPGEPRGSYFTSLPISPVGYRRRHSTPVAFARPAPGTIVMYDDWAKRHTISAPPDVIDALVAECVANEVPPAAPPADEET